MSTGLCMVTGAAGLIGRPLSRRIAEVGTLGTLLAASRSGRNPCETMPGLRLDLSLPLGTLPPGIKTLIHLAGEKRDESRMWAVNRDGTRRLVEAAAAAGVRRFVHLSSVGVYGVAKHSGRVDERFAHTPRNTYEASKDAGEQVVRELCPKLGLECAVVQPSNVLGVVPGSTYPLMGLMRTLRHGRFVRFGQRRVWVNYVAVEDVADAIVAAALSPLSGCTWIVNTPALLDDLVDWVAQELAVTVTTRRLPFALGWSAAQFATLITALTGRPLPFEPQRFLELTNTTVYDGSAITRDTGFAYPLGVETLVRTLARRYRDEGLL